jgi:hypothetical protein
MAMIIIAHLALAAAWTTPRFHRSVLDVVPPQLSKGSVAVPALCALDLPTRSA